MLRVYSFYRPGLRPGQEGLETPIYHVSFGQGDHLCRWNVLVSVKVLRETEPIGIYRDTQEEINYGNGLTQFGG